MSDFLTFRSGDVDRRDVSGEPFGEGAVLRLLEEAGREADQKTSLAKLIAQILVATASSAVRNAAALALVDLGAREEIEALLRVVRRPDLAKDCGTPLFALDELGAFLPLGLVVDLIQNGSFEARSEVLNFVEAGRVVPPTEAQEAATIAQHLAGIVETATDDVAAIAALLLETLSASR